MKTIITILLIVFALAGYSQTPKYSISGRVNAYSPKGKIYVFLCDKKAFEKPLSGLDTLEFWVNYDKKVVEFKFLNVPEGEYAIRSYQDVNGNHKLDKWMLGPLEPWGFSYSEKMTFPPVFEDVSFMLVSDTRINITLGK